MSLPGFSSEASLYRAAGSYRSTTGGHRAQNRVRPALIGDSCCPVRCANGNEGECCCPAGSRCSGYCLGGKIRCGCR